MLHTLFIFSISASFGLPELNRAALANEASASEHSHDIFTTKFKKIFISSLAMQ